MLTDKYIAVVCASPLLAEGLRATLSAVHGWQVSVHAQAADADGDVLVVQGAPAQAALAGALPSAPMVLLTDGMPAGLPRTDAFALALLPPSATPAQLQAAVAAVLEGLSVRDPRWAVNHPAFHADAADHEPLTPRELEVYELVGKGLSNRDIAGVLGISAHTAKYHVGQILAKVGAATRAEAVSAGLRMGIIGL